MEMKRFLWQQLILRRDWAEDHSDVAISSTDGRKSPENLGETEELFCGYSLQRNDCKRKTFISTLSFTLLRE